MAEVKIYERIVRQTIPTIKFDGIEDIQAVSDFIERYGGRFESVTTRPKDEEQAKKNGWHKGEVAWWRILDPINSGYVYQLILKPGDIVAKQACKFEVVFLNYLKESGFIEVKK